SWARGRLWPRTGVALKGRVLLRHSLSAPFDHARIQGVAEGIAQYIHAEKGNGEEEAREQDQIRLDLKVHTPLRHHVAPGRNVQGETRPEKAQSGFCKHCRDRKSTRLNSSHVKSSYAVFWLKKKNY